MRRILALFLVVFALVPTHHAAAAGQLQLVIEPRDSVSPLVSFINAAQHTLDGEVYLATSQPVLSALEAAAARHVTVRINLDPHPFGTSPTVVKRAYNQLASHGVQVRWTSSAFVYTHAKYARIRYDTRLDGTMNWETLGRSRTESLPSSTPIRPWSARPKPYSRRTGPTPLTVAQTTRWC